MGLKAVEQAEEHANQEDQINEKDEELGALLANILRREAQHRKKLNKW